MRGRERGGWQRKNVGQTGGEEDDGDDGGREDGGHQSAHLRRTGRCGCLRHLRMHVQAPHATSRTSQLQ